MLNSLEILRSKFGKGKTLSHVENLVKTDIVTEFEIGKDEVNTYYLSYMHQIDSFNISIWNKDLGLIRPLGDNGIQIKDLVFFN